jgi:AAA15 family ATPase/GTPase
MRYIEFHIQNFKGIKDEKLKLNVVPDLKVFTLVGLNESGKTSVLEAINSFQNGMKDKDKIIPKDKKLNFNGAISISATLALDEADEKRIQDYCKDKGFLLQEKVDHITVQKKIEYKDSKALEKGAIKSNWTLELQGYKASSRKKTITRLFEADRETWNGLVTYLEKDIFPRIILYSNFLFEIPPKIYLAKKNKDEVTTPKHLLATDDCHAPLKIHTLSRSRRQYNITR